MNQVTGADMASIAFRTTLAVLSLCSAVSVRPGEAQVDSGRRADQSDRQPSEVASAWFDLLYQIVKTEGTAPPPASRIYGVTAVALYEAVAPGSSRNRSLVGQLNALTSVPEPRLRQEYDWPAVANAALAQGIRGIFPTLTPASRAAIDALEVGFVEQFRARIGRRVLERSTEHGRAVANAILEWAEGDGFAAFDACPYVPQGVAGAWKPTPPAFSPNPVQPCWGQLRPMVILDGTACAPSGHPPFSTAADSEFAAAARQVRNVGRALTSEQKAIADFWADNAGATGTPPGHWIAIVGQLARTHRLSLMTAAEAYARVGIAVTDSFIAGWNVKYATNLQRPVTYIVENIDPAWQPYLATPPFPTYISGHSTQSGAAAFVLTEQFGRQPFTDTIRADQQLQPPLPARSFRSFAAAAAEAAVSRLYGGIHYGFDNQDGLEAGRCVGLTIAREIRFRDDHDRH
jgi:membrane-associated phospholipid phosphatase